jgi:hypothetical protein
MYNFATILVKITKRRFNWYLKITGMEGCPFSRREAMVA